MPTSLGALPCTARPPRPLSVSSPGDLGLDGIGGGPASPSFMHHRRSLSPFRSRPEGGAVVWEKRGKEGKKLALPSSSKEVTSICATPDDR